MSGSEELIRRTYFWDRVRASSTGVVETANMVFALAIAIEVFDAPDATKGLIASAGPIGLFVTPLTLGLLSRLEISASKLAGVISGLAGLAMAVAAFSVSLKSFLIPCCLAFMLGTQVMPLLVHVWTTNYPSNKRGAFISVSMMFSIVTTFSFSFLGGRLMDYDLGLFRVILGVVAFCYLLGGWAISMMPSTPVSRRESENPVRNLSYAFTDGRFGIMLLSWMFLGFGNLMMLPLRVEYLLQEEYGIEASKTVVSMVTLGIPAVLRFATSRMWGLLFDRIDFLIVRILVNVLIMLSILLFFASKSLVMIGLAAAVLGVAMGGANISWSLWVTKFATPDRTAAYMSVHTFTTGIRGIAAPFLGFYLISNIGAMATGATGAVLILISIVMVFCLYRYQGRARPPRQATSSA